MSNRLIIDASGRLRDPSGKANITYNDPWPLEFSKAGVTGQIDGVVLHTMVGTLESCIETFNSPGAQGSAHVGIGQNGRIHQFVPFGQGYETFHAFAANKRHYGIETEDFGKPHTPISDAGLSAWAQVFECLSSFAGFPLQLLVHEDGKGLGYHRQFADWNLSLHSCPGASFTDMVRVNQRSEIVRRAKALRVPFQTLVHTDGKTSLKAYAAKFGDRPLAIILRSFAMVATQPPLLKYLVGAHLGHQMPKGIELIVLDHR